MQLLKSEQTNLHEKFYFKILHMCDVEVRNIKHLKMANRFRITTYIFL